MSKECFALVFSDLHLGEEDSVFMSADEGSSRKGLKDGVNLAYLEALKDHLSSFVDPSTVRYLILAGDAVDLSLARRKRAFKAFRTFLEGMKDFFREAVVYLPGNHDHHLWVALQEEALIFQKIRAGKDVEPYYHALCPRLSEKDGLKIPAGYTISKPYGKKTFLYYLLPPEARKEKRGFLVAYPNLYVETGRFLLVTHGHFFEETWTLFTDVFRRSLRKMSLKRLSFKKLEQINSPFIEFGWYSLGQAGELSLLIERLWDELHAGGPGPLTESVLEDLIQYLDEKLTPEHKAHRGLWGRFKDALWHLEAGLSELSSDAALKIFEEVIKHLILPRLVPEEVPRKGSALRHHPKILSQEKTRERIARYLEMALPAFPKLDTLIFGHTHVPFDNGKLEIETPGGPRPVTCYNTGGWVTDVYEADHLATARPFIFALSGKGIETIQVPWPSYDEFEHVLEGIHEESEARKRVKDLVWEKLS